MWQQHKKPLKQQTQNSEQCIFKTAYMEIKTVDCCQVCYCQCLNNNNMKTCKAQHRTQCIACLQLPHYVSMCHEIEHRHSLKIMIGDFINENLVDSNRLLHETKQNEVQ